MNRALPSLHRESHEITLTVPLLKPFWYENVYSYCDLNVHENVYSYGDGDGVLLANPHFRTHFLPVRFFVFSFLYFFVGLSILIC